MLLLFLFFLLFFFIFFFFNDTATTEIYTLSLHDALPILFSDFRLFRLIMDEVEKTLAYVDLDLARGYAELVDRKSTRLNSSHSQISYAVFCLKKKKKDKSILIGHRRERGVYIQAIYCVCV